MAQTWPGTVPTDVLQGSYTESPPDNLLRSNMDTGPDKVRRRSTAGPRPISWTILMTTTELGYFETFYVTTLVSGALTFNFTMPRTGASAELRFTSPPQYVPVGGVYWEVNMQLEVVP